MVKQEAEDIYRIVIELPKSPLKYLNAYLIRGDERNLLIDTGERKPECLASMQQGLSELGVRMEDTDIFLTHMHIDHIGLVPDLVTPDTRVYMSEVDTAFQLQVCRPSINSATAEVMRRVGFPEKQINLSPMILKSSYFYHPFMDYTPVSDGHIFRYGCYELHCVSTPGHTPGHMCLYEPKRKLMFCGDHILFEITPNISRSSYAADSLGDYVKSLLAIQKYDVELLLPAHRTVQGDFRDRANEIIEHHGRRVLETVNALEQHPGSTVYSLAQFMTWNIRYDGNWDHFPPAQKPFAVYEVAAHLDYLVNRQRAVKELRDGVEYFTLT